MVIRLPYNPTEVAALSAVWRVRLRSRMKGFSRLKQQGKVGMLMLCEKLLSHLSEFLVLSFEYKRQKQVVFGSLSPHQLNSLTRSEGTAGSCEVRCVFVMTVVLS